MPSSQTEINRLWTVSNAALEALNAAPSKAGLHRSHSRARAEYERAVDDSGLEAFELIAAKARVAAAIWIAQLGDE